MEYTAPLPSRALLRLTGGDVVHFLQNLITCEVEDLADGAASFGALLTPQGKILFDFFLLRESDGFVMDVDSSQRDALAKRLTFYKLRADVQIAMDDRPVFAIWGSEMASGFVDPRLADLGSRHFGQLDGANADESDWHEHRILFGMPQAGRDFEFSDTFPQEALMDQMGTAAGVDFSKGCYVGQEVVSRMQHRGTARNRFVKVVSQRPFAADATGQALTASGKRIGTMGSTAGNWGLALVRVDRATAAIADANPILLGEHEMRLEPPAFTNFDWST